MGTQDHIKIVLICDKVDMRYPEKELLKELMNEPGLSLVLTIPRVQRKNFINKYLGWGPHRETQKLNLKLN